MYLENLPLGAHLKEFYLTVGRCCREVWRELLSGNHIICFTQQHSSWRGPQPRIRRVLIELPPPLLKMKACPSIQAPLTWLMRMRGWCFPVHGNLWGFKLPFLYIDWTTTSEWPALQNEMHVECCKQLAVKFLCWAKASKKCMQGTFDFTESLYTHSITDM